MVPVAGTPVSPQVQRVLKAEGISDDEFGQMLNKAAITTHQRGNRRFHSWVFEVKNGSVWRMSHVDDACVTKPGTVDLTVFEICEACDGDTCKECGYSGEQRVTYKKSK